MGNLDSVETLLFPHVAEVCEHLFCVTVMCECQSVVARPFLQNNIVEVCTFLHVTSLEFGILGWILIKEQDAVGFLVGCYTG